MKTALWAIVATLFNFRYRSSQPTKPVEVAPQGNVISGPLSLPQYMVLEDYKKVQKGELTVTAGSVVVVIEKKHTGRHCYNKRVHDKTSLRLNGPMA